MRSTDTLAGSAITYQHANADARAVADWEGLTFGYFEVLADDVPALVRAGREVWSFGYGWDNDDEFTTLSTDDLESWDFAAHEAGDLQVIGRYNVESWGPFAIAPTVDDYAADIAENVR